MLMRLAYSSQLVPEVTPRKLDALIASAATRNKTLKITGILAVEENRICQILEGPVDEVALLYERIKLDLRHVGVVELDRRQIVSRRFQNWGMARGRMIEIVELAFEAA